MLYIFVIVNNNDMNTKVRKKGSKREKVKMQKRKGWMREKAKRNLTYFDLMVSTQLSETTLRNAFKGYAESNTVSKIDAVLNQEAAA